MVNGQANNGQVDTRTRGHTDMRTCGQITDTWDVVVLLRQQLELDYKHLHDVSKGLGFLLHLGMGVAWTVASATSDPSATSSPLWASTFSGRT